MNKILLSILFLFSPALINANIYNALQMFNMGEARFMSKCIQLKKMFIDEKLALEQDQLNECANLKESIYYATQIGRL